MNRLQQYIIWLRRIKYCRGFCVQSPSAYRFIRYVVSEHYPYYAYADLRKAHPGIDWLTRKRMELYFRIANYRRPSIVADFSDDSTLLAVYTRQGCQKAQTLNALRPSGIGLAEPLQMVRICPIEGCTEFLQTAIGMTDEASVFIIEDIARDDTARQMWLSLLASPKVSVSYDLYYCGVAFFDVKRGKANYIVNF